MFNGPPGMYLFCCMSIGLRLSKSWGLNALCHGIQNSMEAVLACHPALSTEWLCWVANSCWRIRTSPIGVYVNNIHQARVNIGWYLASAIWPSVRTVDRVYIRLGKYRRGQPCAPRAISRAKYQPIFTNARWILYLYLKNAKRKLLVDWGPCFASASETAVLVQWSVAAELTWSIFFPAAFVNLQIAQVESPRILERVVPVQVRFAAKSL